MFTTCRQLSRACDRAALRQLWKGKFARCMADSANSETRSPRRRLTSDFLLPQASATNTPTVLLILNWTLPKCTARLWSNASLRVCADGGANRLFGLLPTLFPAEDAADVRRRFVPDIIRGDLDSIHPEVLEFYRDRGAEVIDESHDQDSTDLQKCLKSVAERRLEHAAVIAAGALGGRVDHTLSNLNCLFLNETLNLVLLGDGNACRAVPAGASVIVPAAGVDGPACGLIPLKGPAVASTTGLRWNLDRTKMAFGGLLSSCNIIDAPEVTVDTDVPLLWTTECKDEL